MMFRLILAILVLHMGAGMPKCPRSGYSSWNKLGPNCVKYFPQEVNFNEAEMRCRGLATHSRLISIHDGATSDAIRFLTGSSHTRVWIGGYKLGNGKFVWTDGSTWDYTNWVPGQPDGNGDCVQINWSVPGMWDDVQCWASRRYICAFKI